MTRIVLSVILYFALVATALAAELTTIQAPEAPPSAELQVLRAQLETTKQYQDSFIVMAQWTLGTAIAVALTIAGFGWYSNKASFDRERQALLNESRAIKDSLTATIATEFEKEREKLKAELAEGLVNSQAAVEKALLAKFRESTKALSSVQSQVFDLTAESLDREAKEAARAGRHGWAIYKYCELLKLFVKRDTDFYEAAEVLDAIRQILKTPNVELDSDTVNSTVETLKKLPAKHHAACDPLIDMLKRSLT